MATSTEGRLGWARGQTWYRVVGDLDPAAALTPLVILHGGPGAAHDYCEPIADLVAQSGRACVLYDQLGCGLSQHLPEAPVDFWTPQLFKDELVALTAHLGIADRYMVIGQSWGGMLGMEHALDHPPGLRALVVADSPASMRLWVEEANRLRALLPPAVEATLRRHEDAGTTDSAEYEAAVNVFYDRHLCRVPQPAAVQASFAQIAQDPTVYHTMNGPSEFHCIGTLKDWDVTDRLPTVDVPTLLVSGAHDEATPRIVGEIHDRIPGSRWELFAYSSHMPHVEEPAKFKEVLTRFLAEHDRA
ncbi:MAG: proline iminopeptidase-family hydrolase [Kineosporiaceae bacterium]|jgi:L-proline amide hydrolase